MRERNSTLLKEQYKIIHITEFYFPDFNYTCTLFSIRPQSDDACFERYLS